MCRNIWSSGGSIIHQDFSLNAGVRARVHIMSFSQAGVLRLDLLRKAVLAACYGHQLLHQGNLNLGGNQWEAVQLDFLPAHPVVFLSQHFWPRHVKPSCTSITAAR